MKKKLFFFTCVLIVCCMHVLAQHRSEQEAMQIAQDYFNKNARMLTPHLAKANQKDVTNQLLRHRAAANLKHPKQNSYYIFNDEANNRFVIVSSDERFYKILGYSDNGIFNASQAPHALLELLNSYDEQYDYMLKYEPNAPKVEQRSYDFPDISPIIKSKWGQGTPFNDDCPVSIKSGENCVTGCVATAMAMVMRHHRWPLQGKGSYTYVAQIDSTQSETLSMDFSSLHFNWDNLIDNYKDGAGTTEQRAEVARLMKACGVSVAMNYGADASGALEYSIAYALTHYFGYNPNILYKKKDYYPNEEWDEMILTELKAGRPVLYAGYRNFLMGHSFILDGCASDGSYHFNFGWNGTSDGNFYLQGTDKLLYYCNDQDMVYQVSEEITGKHEDVFYSSSFKSNKTATKLGKSARFALSSSCYSPRTARMDNISDSFEGEIGIGLYDKDFNFVQVLYSEPCNTNYASISKDISMNSDIFKNGNEYIIAPYAKSTDAQQPTRIRTQKTAYDYYLAKVENDSVKLWIKGIEFHKIPMGTYKAVAIDANNKPIEWYVTLKKKSSDYEYTILNLDPNVVPDSGNGYVQATMETDATGLHLTTSRLSTNDNVNVKNFSLEKNLTISYDSNNKCFTINGEWGSVKTVNTDNKKEETELTRYSNTVLTYLSPDEMKVTVEMNKAGELENRLNKDNKYFVNTLIISGELNGTDIKEVRKLMTNGSLMHLDLSKANIVEGGDAYYSSDTTQDGIIGSNMFSDGENILSLKLPENLREIGSYAFYRCSKLKELEIPEGVTCIGFNAFKYCSSLSKVLIPYSIKILRDDLFESCGDLENIYCYSLNIDKVTPSTYGNAGELKAFNDVTDGCTWHVVKGKAELYKAQSWWKSSWTIVDDMDKPYEEELAIADNQAGNLSSQISENISGYITSLTISGELNGTDIRKIRNMLQNGFLSNLDIQNAKIVAGGDAYSSTYSKESYTQNDTIGEYMFDNSPYLESIKLPTNLKAIGQYAFYRCKSLRSLEIPEGIKTMESSILSDCEKMESLSIPSTVKIIDDYSLNGCSSLKNIHCAVMEIDKVKASYSSILKAFDAINDNCTWHVVKGKAELYKAQSWWKSSWTIVDDMDKPYEEELTIADNQAGNLSSQISENISGYITSLTISGELNGTDIRKIRNMLQNGFLSNLDIQNAKIVAGGDAYSSTYSKESYTQNDTIGEYMFDNSPYLESIKLPTNLKAIGQYAFYRCKSLRSLEIPEGIKTMESSILSDCEKMESLSIPSTVKIISDNSLNGCSSLKNIHCAVMEIDKVKASYSSILKAFDAINDNCTWHVVKGKAELYKAQSWWKSSWTIVDDMDKPYEEELTIADNQAGNLSSQISENISGYITSLTISGELNGTDIRKIRNMLQNGFLSNLDIQNVKIVAGGDAYSSTYSKESYTQNDTIGEHMFDNSPYLESIKLPTNLKAIGQYAFYRCKSLRSLEIPEGIKTMESSILSDCEKLESLAIPSTIKIINDYSLNGCSSLKTIHCFITEIDKIKASTYGQVGKLKAFDNLADGTIWHVVNGTKKMYQEQVWWTNDTWIIVEDIITDINLPRHSVEDNASWYTLKGNRLIRKPTKPGIYLHGGHKIVIR